MSDIMPIETRPDRLWREYCEAREKAERSTAIEDGIAAGRAWRRFLAEFDGTANGGGMNDQRSSIALRAARR